MNTPLCTDQKRYHVCVTGIDWNKKHLLGKKKIEVLLLWNGILKNTFLLRAVKWSAQQMSFGQIIKSRASCYRSRVCNTIGLRKSAKNNSKRQSVLCILSKNIFKFWKDKNYFLLKDYHDESETNKFYLLYNCGGS